MSTGWIRFLAVLPVKAHSSRAWIAGPRGRSKDDFAHPNAPWTDCIAASIKNDCAPGGAVDATVRLRRLAATDRRLG
jgi:hypothetical protein